MDLGFARRQRGRAAAKSSASQLASLLSELAARQALSPTARAAHAADSDMGSCDSGHPEVTPFVPGTRLPQAGNAPVSFHPQLSAAILSLCQPS